MQSFTQAFLEIDSEAGLCRHTVDTAQTAGFVTDVTDKAVQPCPGMLHCPKLGNGYHRPSKPYWHLTELERTPTFKLTPTFNNHTYFHAHT